MSLYPDYAGRPRDKYQVFPLLIQEQFEALADSDEALVVIDGNARWLEAGALGVGNFPVEFRQGEAAGPEAESASRLMGVRGDHRGRQQRLCDRQ